MYKTKVTSQGTITLPTALRRKYDLQTGDILSLEDTGKIIITKVFDFADIRAKNRGVLKKVASYKQGDGMGAHVRETYEKK